MPVIIANRRRIAGVAIAALFAVFGAQAPIANSDRARTISLYNIHTKETITVLFKQDGKYIPEALEKVNWALRDWRKNEPTKMDPALIDLLWEVHTELGSQEPIHIISGFRSKGTNEMLRRTVGGQASESRHILGKAADVHFPDVPLKRIRYSALVRERGGVGYYPTSALPFVHLDTDRVRAWPRLPRYELALLFPSGRTQHQPADGGPITKEDVQIAQSKHRDLVQQVAEFQQARNRPVTTMQVASLAPKPPMALAAPAAQIAQVSAPKPAAAAPQLTLASLTVEQPPAPRLASAPRIVERSSRFTQPSTDERAKLAQLSAMASFDPQPIGDTLIPARPKSAEPLLASLTGVEPRQASPTSTPAVAPQIAALTPEASTSLTDPGRFGWGTGWALAPAFDEEHPDELSYQPFPVSPYLTATASLDDPALLHMSHPDAARSLEMLDQSDALPAMRLRPTPQVARLLWAQEFKGGPTTDIDSLFTTSGDLLPPVSPAGRPVKVGMK